MHSFRRQLRRVAGGWVIAQVCVLVLASGVMALTGAAAVECTCTHGDAHSCPMHHPQPASKSTCSCRSTSDGPTAAVAALLGPIAVVPSSLVSEPAPLRGERVDALAASLFDVPSVPDGPPPRA